MMWLIWQLFAFMAYQRSKNLCNVGIRWEQEFKGSKSQSTMLLYNISLLSSRHLNLCCFKNGFCWHTVHVESSCIKSYYSFFGKMFRVYFMFSKRQDENAYTCESNRCNQSSWMHDFMTSHPLLKWESLCTRRIKMMQRYYCH